MYREVALQRNLFLISSHLCAIKWRTLRIHNDQNLQNQRIPKSVVVKGGNAQRTRSTKINPKTGDITEIRMENGENTAVYDMEHDDYGNITKLTRPKNHNGDRFWNAYTYDTEVHSFVTDIDNAYNYHSSNEFDYRFGVPTRTTDINGNTIAYEYDDFGRPTKLTSPYETDYTLKFRYDLSNKTAETKHFTKEGDITTTTICDDLMRPVKVSRSAVVEDAAGEITSGVMVYDAFGRCVKEYPTPTKRRRSTPTTNSATNSASTIQTRAKPPSPTTPPATF